MHRPSGSRPSVQTHKRGFRSVPVINHAGHDLIPLTITTGLRRCAIASISSEQRSDDSEAGEREKAFHASSIAPLSISLQALAVSVDLHGAQRADL